MGCLLRECGMGGVVARGSLVCNLSCLSLSTSINLCANFHLLVADPNLPLLTVARVHLLKGKRCIAETDIELVNCHLPVMALAEQHKVDVVRMATTSNDTQPSETSFKPLQNLYPLLDGGPQSHVWLEVKGERALGYALGH